MQLSENQTSISKQRQCYVEYKSYILFVAAELLKINIMTFSLNILFLHLHFESLLYDDMQSSALKRNHMVTMPLPSIEAMF